MSVPNNNINGPNKAPKVRGFILLVSFALLIIASITLPLFFNGSRLTATFGSSVSALGFILTVIGNYPNAIAIVKLPKIKIQRSAAILTLLLIVSLSINIYALLYVGWDPKPIPTPSILPSATSSFFTRTPSPTSNATSTPSPGLSNGSLPSYIPGHRNLIMSNPWINNNPPSHWDTTNETGSGKPGAGNCEFTADGFHISADQSYRECVEYSRDLTNCVVEAQMTLLPGSAGGIILRRNIVSNVGGYLVDFDQNGHYTITVDKDLNHSVELRDNSSGLIQNNHTSYRVDVEILGDQITLFVDGTKIDSVTDNTFSHGYIGLYVTQYGNGTPQKTEVIITNLRVWSL